MVFVTGGTGLLGSHLLVELTQQHDSITAIYRDAIKIETVKNCFKYYLKEKAETHFNKIIWKEGDIMDIPLLEEMMKNHKIIYHCAGMVSYNKRDFTQMMEINRYGTANMVNIAMDLGVEKFCYVSSSAAVGNKDIPSGTEVDENGKWVLDEETSGYSVSKYSAEKEVWRGINEGLKAVIVNPTVIIGAGKWSESSMKIFNTIRKNSKYYPPGANAFVDARDVAQIMIELVHRNISNERFLCTGENVTFKRLFDIVAKELNQNPPSKEIHLRMMKFVWRLASLWAVLTFSKPKMTKMVVRNAFSTMKFSNRKVKDTLGHEFHTLEEMVENGVKGRLV